uniref:RNA helicase n=1 Tax=Percolomonas cosmopolitus TaxID=63605 RepID=A0A7S1KPB1_9EUKA
MPRKTSNDDTGGPRFTNYEYKGNSSVVLFSEKSRGGARENQDAGGVPIDEVQSLVGKMGFRFGDRHEARKPPKIHENIKAMHENDVSKKSKKRTPAPLKNSASSTDILATNVYQSTHYQPKLESTTIVYEGLLAFVEPYISSAADEELLRDAVDEILITLKDDSLTDPERKQVLSEFLPGIDTDAFHKLVQLGRSITDYTPPDEGDQGMRTSRNAPDSGVSLIFQEEENSETAMSQYVVDTESDEEAEESRTDMDTLKRAILTKEEQERDEMYVNALDIDDLWLQSQLAQVVGDLKKEETANGVVEALSAEDLNDQLAENELMRLLNFENFPLIHKLIYNRWKIVYSIQLKRASTADERRAILSKMRRDPALRLIINELHDVKQGASVESIDAMDTTEDAPISLENRLVIDLNNLQFESGSHFMSNDKVRLPPSAKHEKFKTYEQVHIPAPPAPELKKGEKKVSLKNCPGWIHPAFPGVSAFNRMQSAVYESALMDSHNMLVCAPTGAGKTNAAVLCMLHEIGQHLNQQKDDSGNYTLKDSDFKIVYVAPMKALVHEVMGNLKERLTTTYGVTVAELTGDSSMTQYQLSETHVIVTTPEKWDIVTRKSNDRSLLDQVRLLIIDEIHLLHDDRGPVLESIVARTIRHQEMTNEHVRIVGISATLPNYVDVATFLRVEEAGLFHFSNAYRPVPLHQTYIGVTQRKALQRMHVMNELAYEKVIEKVPEKQCIVFVHTRKDTAKTAEAIRDIAVKNDTLSKFFQSQNDPSLQILRDTAKEIKDPELKQLLPYGFGIHHAGLTKSDRAWVEDLMADKHIKVLCSTATLAWGVNLPATLVVIKGTQVYNPEKGAWEELSALDVMQMMGRAGRPQYDSVGYGTIITTQMELQYYLSLLNEQLPIESQMIKRLPDILNAEIALGSIQHIDDAIAWLGYTYLYVRMVRNPELYGVTQKEIDSDEYLFQRRTDLANTAASLLHEHGLVIFDKKTGALETTDLGRIASHFYISHPSIATYNQHLNPNMNVIDVLRLFSMSEEFKYLVVRRNEKVELQKLLNSVPIPIKESVDEPIAKANALLQAYISRLSLEGFSIASDLVYITQSASRLIRALFEIALSRGWSQVSGILLDLAKMVDNRMWKTQTPLRQFKGIPQKIISSLERTDIPFDRLANLSIPELGELVNDPKSGTRLKAAIHQFPRLDFSAHMQPITRSMMKIDLTITSAFEYNEQIHGPAQRFWVIVDDVNEEQIIHYEPFVLYKRFAQEEEHYLSFTVSLFDPLPPQYFIKIISDRWIGSHTVLPLSFRKVILPAKFAPPTELEDMPPVPVSALNNKAMEIYYQETFNMTHFGAIHSQIFSALFNTNENCLIAAPSGSENIISAEIAMISLLNTQSDAKIVYIAPNDEIADKQLSRWSDSFAEVLGIPIFKLNGQTQADVAKLNQGRIIVSTPKHWDVLSRQWRTQQGLQQIDLFIADELQFIGGTEGPIIEVIVSRMRFIASQIEKQTRIIGLSTSVADAQELGEWLGASIKKETLFNFAPDTRPVRLNVTIQGFQTYNYQGRILSMYKSTYAALKDNASNNSVVFVGSAQSARTMAVEFASSVSSELNPRLFLHISEEELEESTQDIENSVLRHTLKYGVGFIFEGMAAEDRAIVEGLYNAKAFSIMVCHYKLCWGVTLKSKCVVLMGTQHYDAVEHRHVNYSITDLVQMVGIASPRGETDAQCHILCHAPKKEYYKKFLLNPYPVESHLDHFLADHFNAEIVNGTIKSMQQCIDYLTWTFLYRRIRKNPNYYNLQGTTNTHISEFLSELVENTLTELEEANCIELAEEEINALNLGKIAAYYNVKYTTIDLFSNSVQQNTKMQGILAILCAASEFDSIPIREGEENLLRRYAAHVPLKLTSTRFTEPATKVNILLQCHFSRIRMNALLEKDKRVVMRECSSLIKALADVISTHSWLAPSLVTMDLSQMVHQAMWDKDADLLQLPYFDIALGQKFSQHDVDTVFDLIEMDDAQRSQILQFTPEQMQDLAKALNRFPNIEVEYAIENADNIVAGGAVQLYVEFHVDEEDEEILSTPIHAPFFPEEKYDEWWLLVCDTKSNHVYSIRRLPIRKSFARRIQFPAPSAPGATELKLMLMNDSIRGADQEFSLNLNVGEAEDGMEDEE